MLHRCRFDGLAGRPTPWLLSRSERRAERVAASTRRRRHYAEGHEESRDRFMSQAELICRMIEAETDKLRPWWMSAKEAVRLDDER
jgi:hypothetical protein